MMRLWRESYTKPALFLLTGSAGFSLAVHMGLISLAVLRTRPPASLPSDGLANRVYYIPPPDRVRPAAAHGEVIRYVSLTPSGIGVGLGNAVQNAAKPAVAEQSAAPGNDVARDSVELSAVPTPAAGKDSAFTVLEVDSAVVRAENSAAPAYPLALLQKGITGSVQARYVVDTTGFADTASFEVMRSTHAEFVAAVRAALPYMRFSPAKIGSHRVRQLVEQEFTFKIAPPEPAVKKPTTDD
jgi:outer membrane biosynthesis protein TonB